LEHLIQNLIDEKPLTTKALVKSSVKRFLFGILIFVRSKFSVLFKESPTDPNI